MKYSFAALAFAATGAVAAYNNGTVYTTEIVTALTTYCPAATEITQNGVTYTITEATTLTITNCPCTVINPVIPTPVIPAPVNPAPMIPAPVIPAPVAPVPAGPAGPSTVLYTSCESSATATTAPVLKNIPAKESTFYSNPLTVIQATGASTPTGATPSQALFTGAANANKVGVMVGAVAGIAALAL
ncbi:Clock-controlled protein [Lachnellula hyalina]|uniref:Clock-controlled protein n=1 Tax=Lachnellula hyalina TaxID=1316788 RepID=A0A8H8R6T6_9HELO|nr:Clock-controlled protein [Lachnellula hyalina]TVY29520.1 Clock-controlled protein [Lachnellula hyalina]